MLKSAYGPCSPLRKGAKGVDLLQILFGKLYIAPAVHRELTKVEQMGAVWVAPVKEAMESLRLTEKQTSEVEHLVVTHPSLGAGELETFVLAKAHTLLCLTNDRQAKRACSALDVPFLDLEEILRALKIKGLLTPLALEQVIEQIEVHDHTRIKAKRQILRD